jgi:hypothetical protein
MLIAFVGLQESSIRQLTISNTWPEMTIIRGKTVFHADNTQKQQVLLQH